MRRFFRFAVVGIILSVVASNFGCQGRLISEGLGVVTGASGKAVDLSRPSGLEKYQGLKLEPITTSSGLKTPPELPSLLSEELLKAAANKGLTPDGKPALILTAEILNFESAGAVDTAIGPLEEVILRAQLTDAQSKDVLGVANLIGRATSTSSGGPKHLSEGAGKALTKWLKEGGITKGEQKGKE
jgi:hypothetical protein